MKLLTVGILSSLQMVTNHWGNRERLCDLLEQLVGDRNPSWETEISPQKFKTEYPKTFDLIETTKVDVMKRTYVRNSLDTWTIEESGVSIEDAVKTINAYPRNFIMVSKAASELMKDKLTCDTYFVDGFVHLSGKQIKAYD